jgi:D-3-phosphoglycerate dehydrogenase
VDLAAAQDHGIPVFNAPFSNTRRVAAPVPAGIIPPIRGVPWRNAQTHRGNRVKTATGSHEIRGRTLCVVGCGHIGTQIGLPAEAPGMRVIFCAAGRNRRSVGRMNLAEVGSGPYAFIICRNPV